MRNTTLPYRLGTALPDGFPGLVYNRRAHIPTVALGGNPAARIEMGRRRSAA